MTPRPPLLVLAGSKRQFDLFCQMNDLNPRRDAYYISAPSQVFGFMYPKYVITGTWASKPYNVVSSILKHLEMSFGEDVSREYKTT